MSKIRTLVVDDEPMARERILGLLAQETDVEVIGQCADGVQAVESTMTFAPPWTPDRMSEDAKFALGY